MIETFQARAAQNIQAAELLLNAGLHDACANRAYYACFHAAFVACLSFGVEVKLEHSVVLSRFCSELVSRRKIFPATVKEDLYELRRLREQGDYQDKSVSRNKAAKALKITLAALTIIAERTTSGESAQNHARRPNNHRRKDNKMTVYDLPPLQQRLALVMYQATKERFPEIETDFSIEFSPDDKDYILLSVTVPARFYDSQEELDFSRFTAGLTADTHLDTGVLISLMERYEPATA